MHGGGVETCLCLSRALNTCLRDVGVVFGGGGGGEEAF